MSVDTTAAAAPIADATTEILKTGLLGALLIIVGIYAFWVTRQWNAAQEARVADNKATTDMLLKLSEKMSDAAQGMTAAMNALKTYFENASADQKRSLGVIDTAVTDIVRTTDTVKLTTDGIKATADDIKRSVEDLRRKG